MADLRLCPAVGVRNSRQGTSYKPSCSAHVQDVLGLNREGEGGERPREFILESDTRCEPRTSPVPKSRATKTAAGHRNLGRQEAKEGFPYYAPACMAG